MSYSDCHKYFANRLNRDRNINYQDVLDHPEKYLGPNYKEVLNYWFYWESLSDEQKTVYWERWWELDIKTRDRVNEIAEELASEVIDSRIIGWLFCREKELVAAHLYIERGIPFTFLPLIFEL